MISSKTYKIKENVICEKIDGEMILFYPETNCIINLNKSASRICELLNTKKTIIQLVDTYYEQLEDDGKPNKDIVIKDIYNVIQVLESQKLVEVEWHNL